MGHSVYIECPSIFLKEYIIRGGCTMENLYHTTGRIEQLKQRVNRCVCKFCGKQISLYRIIFSDIAEARVELYCDNCGRIEFGIEPEIYHCACNFVDNLEFDYYEGMDNNIKKDK